MNKDYILQDFLVNVLNVSAFYDYYVRGESTGLDICKIFLILNYDSLLKFKTDGFLYL